MIQEQIAKLKGIVNQNSMGHLPLSCRVDLMKQIGNTLVVQKILCECCKKVYPLWVKVIGEETPLLKLLSDADNYLYKGKGSAESILASAERLENYTEEINHTEAMAGYAIIALAYEIKYDAATILEKEDYNGEDDDAFDSDEWSPDFIASIAYAYGYPFSKNKGDAERRKEYWLWFLDMVLAIYKWPDKPYLRIATPPKQAKTLSMPKRIQNWQVNNILNQLQQIISDLIREVDKQVLDWTKVELYYTRIDGQMLETFYIEKDKKQRVKLDTVTFYAIANSLYQIQEDMYKQAPGEGAWMQCNISINKDVMYDIQFNYDDIALISEIFTDPGSLISIFEDYPRSKEYTPQWYRDIIGNRKLYLN